MDLPPPDSYTLHIIGWETQTESGSKMLKNQVIQMNMEIALVCAQLCVMAGARAADNHDLVNIIFNDSSSYIYCNHHHQMELCRLISILTHLFYTTAFTFMFLEALHTYRCKDHENYGVLTVWNMYWNISLKKNWNFKIYLVLFYWDFLTFLLEIVFFAHIPSSECSIRFFNCFCFISPSTSKY